MRRSAQSPCQASCEHIEIKPTVLYVGTPVALREHAQRDIVIPGTNHIDTGRWKPLLYMFRHYFGTGSDLGRTFKAEA